MTHAEFVDQATKCNDAEFEALVAQQVVAMGITEPAYQGWATGALYHDAGRCDDVCKKSHPDKH